MTVTRYCASMSETSLTEQCKADPKLVASWLDLAQCQATRGADAGVVVGTLSKALQANKHSPVCGHHDLVGLYYVLVHC